MAMTFQDARRLLARTGCGGTPAEIRQLAKMDREAAVDYLLSGTTHEAKTSPPSDVLSALPPAEGMKGMTFEQKKAFKQERREEAVELKGWWYQVMLATPSPLTERMTLFWHNHFTSSFQKVKWPALLYRQNVLLRSHAVGSFRDLLFQIAKDPAMVVYLDTQTNRKDHPNENFARELFELFTLGEGHYAEADIKEAARALTGWHVAKHHGAVFSINREQHDPGVKGVLGKIGTFGGTDHGTAATHLLLGGRVKGGLYGVMPSLTDLQEGDLKHQIDHRSLYSTLVTNWWGLPATFFGKRDHAPIDCLA